MINIVSVLSLTATDAAGNISAQSNSVEVTAYTPQLIISSLEAPQSIDSTTDMFTINGTVTPNITVELHNIYQGQTTGAQTVFEHYNNFSTTSRSDGSFDFTPVTISRTEYFVVIIKDGFDNERNSYQEDGLFAAVQLL